MHSHGLYLASRTWKDKNKGSVISALKSGNQGDMKVYKIFSSSWESFQLNGKSGKGRSDSKTGTTIHRLG